MSLVRTRLNARDEKHLNLLFNSTLNMRFLVNVLMQIQFLLQFFILKHTMSTEITINTMILFCVSHEKLNKILLFFTIFISSS